MATGCFSQTESLAPPLSLEVPTMKTALLIASFAVTFALAAPSQPRNADPRRGSQLDDTFAC
jgi:hypothetical protein